MLSGNKPLPEPMFDPFLCQYMATLGHKKLMNEFQMPIYNIKKFIWQAKFTNVWKLMKYQKCKNLRGDSLSKMFARDWSVIDFVCIIGPLWEESPLTSEYLSKRASAMQSISMAWYHHASCDFYALFGAKLLTCIYILCHSSTLTCQR